MKRRYLALAILAPWLMAQTVRTQEPATAEVKNLTLNGGVEDGKARLVIEALLNGKPGDQDKLIFATTVEHTISATREKLVHQLNLSFDILRGKAKEIPLTIGGEGEIKKVTGEGLQDWSIRQEVDGKRTLVLRPKEADKPIERLAVSVIAERELKAWKNPLPAFTLTPPQPALLNGFVKVQSSADLDLQAENPTGLSPLTVSYLPANLQTPPDANSLEPLAYQLHGSAYSLPLRIAAADPETRQVVLRDFKLTGQVQESTVAFTLTATAQVKNNEGGSMTLLAGGVALTELAQSPDWRITADQGRYVLIFPKAGTFPLQFKFNAAVRQAAGVSSVDFRVASSTLQPIVLQGLPVDTQFQFAGAAKPERTGDTFTSFLPPNGEVKLSWRGKPPENEGKLFYSAEMLSQISIGPGLMRQIALLDGKVMQGELDRVTLSLRGSGEVTRVLGDKVLAWKVEPGANASERRLSVQFNQPQKGVFSLQVQMQTPIAAFPQTIEAMQIRPEGATRFAGYFRVVNDGAVRLEVVESKGLSQVSPEQFPETDITKAAFRAAEGQKFAYRFSGNESVLRIQADQILPELTVSEVLAYHLGENELSIDAEIEVDVREAPLREMILRVPKGYAVARLNAENLNDYFLRDAEGTDAELRLVYGQPITGRQAIQLRLERNQALGAAEWSLPRIEVTKAKSVRGHIAVTADAGFRLTAERTQALSEIAPAFFPRKLAGIQTAFRLSEPNWQTTIRVERLPQTIQADAFHLFSIAEGVAYGSSVINYAVSGAPISNLKVDLSAEYFNVEFTGKDIRSWQKTDTGYVVQLHTPVSGPYTLLATYERPFKSQGDTLAFTGIRPLDIQSEQGYTLVISSFQFQVKPVDVSTTLTPLEAGEVPSEYRLLFDAPVLAAYRYSARPFNLTLALSPLAQGDSISQVVDRASLETRISKEGQVLTDAHYFVKNRGNSNFRLALPADTQLWSATVNGAAVVPVTDNAANLIPLPQQADADAVLKVDLKLASRSKSATRIRVLSPTVSAPVLLTEWKFAPDTAQRLEYRKGTLTPIGQSQEVSGFAQLVVAFTTGDGALAFMRLAGALLLATIAVLIWRATTKPCIHRFSFRFWAGLLVGLTALFIAGVCVISLAELIDDSRLQPTNELTFLAPVQQAGQALSVDVANYPIKSSVIDWIVSAWPAFFAPVALIMGWFTGKARWTALAWTLLAWSTLRWPNGGCGLLIIGVLFVAIYILWPALRGLWNSPKKPTPDAPSAPNAATATAAIVGTALLFSALGASAQAQVQTVPPPPPVIAQKENPVAEIVSQDVRVDGLQAFATAKIHWNAQKGQRLPLLFEPAVLTKAAFPEAGLKLVQLTVNSRRTRQLLAIESGSYDIELQYQVAVGNKESEAGITLPVQPGLVNRLAITLVNLDVDVVSPQAVSIERKANGKDTVGNLVLTPVLDQWIAWKPRSRDAAKEKVIFYSELAQLYIPTVGIIEGVHYASIRPAQGELREMVFTVPKGVTITDVLDAATLTAEKDKKVAAVLSQWRFDPDAGKLRITLTPPQSRPFALLLRSQIATGPLPVEQTVGMVTVDDSAGQIGMLGVATGNEVQLDNVDANALTPINLEDYPPNMAAVMQAQIPGITVRRAYRYADLKATAALKTSAVEPDVRVESQDTLSLGEDRVVLAVNSTVDITRAGIFRLSFTLPAGFDVESVGGETVSHWTELKSDAGRIITVHLRSRTEGRQTYAISLTGQGLKSVKAWAAPQVIFREATKQRGSYVVVPEQGMRLQVNKREGVTQLDPEKSGIKQKGVLAFRVLQTPWSLALDIEQVDPWVQVTSLQHAAVTEAQVKVSANLQYQIENTGLKSMRVFLPAGAESVQFQGEQISDFLQVPNVTKDGMQAWDVKLQRKVIGPYRLQVNYQFAIAEKATTASIRGVLADGVNLQRGFVTTQSAGRLQLRVENPPAALQATEWQSIPRALQQDLTASSASFAYRVVDPVFELQLKVERHEAAKLLPARVNNISLRSIVSDNGAMLTQVRIEMIPGDKRLLHLTLPKDARFWFAFVNRNGVWPWRDGEQILVPLEQPSKQGNALPVEFFFSSQIGKADSSDFDLNLVAPKIDLPLENITWEVFLSEKWRVQNWTGSLQLQEQHVLTSASSVDVQTYLQGEAGQLQQKTKAAEEMLVLGNRALELGNPQEARRAFESAFGLSQHDNAFNEDARVQLHNLKIQQAVVGLNVRQSVANGLTDAVSGKLRAEKDANYTQNDAKEILSRNDADDNAAFNRLAERLVQQQDAAVSNPAAIRASIPEQGSKLTFSRSVAVDPWADLQIGLEAKAIGQVSWFKRFIAILLIGVGMWGALRAGASWKRAEA